MSLSFLCPSLFLYCIFYITFNDPPGKSICPFRLLADRVQIGPWLGGRDGSGKTIFSFRSKRGDTLWVFGQRTCFTSIEISELSIHCLFVDFVQRKPGPWLGGWVGPGSLTTVHTIFQKVSDPLIYPLLTLWSI